MSCFFGHKWANWKPIKVKNTYYNIAYDVQERQCNRCGLTKRKGMRG